MTPSPQQAPALTFYPLSLERWADFERLFGKNGADGGCWCMWWRLKRTEFYQQAGEANKLAMHDLVAAGETTGILAYAADEPVGWCSVAPRERFSSLERSRTLKRVDDQPVWSIVCFFVAKSYRRLGVAENLVRAAIDFVAQQGGRIVEAYPSVAIEGATPSSGYMGSVSTFAKVGFVAFAQPSARKVIMRYSIAEGRP
jgi:GNAT superfamily N-acetyltransferase